MKKIFVYGTLKEGGSNHYLIEPYVKSIKDGYIKGYKQTSYITAIESDTEGSEVYGEIIEFNNEKDEKEAFKSMDMLEGSAYELINVLAFTLWDGTIIDDVYFYKFRGGY